MKTLATLRQLGTYTNEGHISSPGLASNTCFLALGALETGELALKNVGWDCEVTLPLETTVSVAGLVEAA